MEETIQIQSLLATIVIGAIALAIIYHGIVYYFIRDYLVFHYIIFLISFGIYTGYVAGIYGGFFGNRFQDYFQRYFSEGSLMLFLFCYYLFIIKAFNIEARKKQFSYKFWVILIGGILLYGISITIFSIATKTDNQNITIISIVKFVIYSINLVLLWLYFKQKPNLFQKIILYGSAIFLLFGFMSFYFRNKPIIAAELLVLGGFIDIVFFSGALNFRIRKTIYNLHKNLLFNANEKLKIKDELLQKQQDLENERSRIALDMHDDLGSGLTKINYLAQTSGRSTNIDKNLEKIKLTSSDLIENMSNIIWAMKQENDTLQDLLNYIKIYAYDYLETNEIELKINFPEIKENIEISGHIRRNTFLIIKEILHNIVKHSKTKKAEIHIQTEGFLQIEIEDFGIGFDCHSLPENKGNGLGNMKKRVQKLNGKIACLSSKNGTKYEIEIPVETFPKKINQKDY